jgi:hypothetical protein
MTHALLVNVCGDCAVISDDEHWCRHPKSEGKVPVVPGERPPDECPLREEPLWVELSSVAKGKCPQPASE